MTLGEDLLCGCHSCNPGAPGPGGTLAVYSEKTFLWSQPYTLHAQPRGKEWSKGKSVALTPWAQLDKHSHLYKTQSLDGFHALYSPPQCEYIRQIPEDRVQDTKTRTSIAFQGTVGSRKSAQLNRQSGDYLLIPVLWLNPGGVTC